MPETSCWCRLTRLAAWADIAMQARASGVRATSWRERFLDWITLDLPMGWTRGRHRAGRSLSLLSNESTGRPLGRYPLPAAVLIHRSEEHTSELQSQMRISYAVFG